MANLTVWACQVKVEETERDRRPSPKHTRYSGILQSMPSVSTPSYEFSAVPLVFQNVLLKSRARPAKNEGPL